MTRLWILVEGQTEEYFVNDLLAPHLYSIGFTKVVPSLLGNSRKRRSSGGIKGWPLAQRDIKNLLTSDRQCYVSTMVDYYGLPQSGSELWPGRNCSANLTVDQKAELVRKEMLNDIIAMMGVDSFYPVRFIPNVMMHEFEALLFSDCRLFGEGINMPRYIPALTTIRSQFDSPEEINDSHDTCPSRRITGLIKDYNKPLMGVTALKNIKLDRTRQECRNFDLWIRCLENIVRESVS